MGSDFYDRQEIETQTTAEPVPCDTWWTQRCNDAGLATSCLRSANHAGVTWSPVGMVTSDFKYVFGLICEIGKKIKKTITRTAKIRHNSRRLGCRPGMSQRARSIHFLVSVLKTKNKQNKRTVQCSVVTGVR